MNFGQRFKKSVNKGVFDPPSAFTNTVQCYGTLCAVPGCDFWYTGMWCRPSKVLFSNYFGYLLLLSDPFGVGRRSSVAINI